MLTLGLALVLAAAARGQDTPPQVAYAKTKAVFSPLPPYPNAARLIPAEEQTCFVRFFIDTNGIPMRLAFEECPTVFQPSAEATLMTWRFEPVKMDGEPTEAQFLLKIAYKLPPGSFALTRDQLEAIRAAFQEVPSTAPGCQVGARILADGGIDSLTTSAKSSCLFVPSTPGKRPKGVRRATEPVVCEVTFDVERTSAWRLEVAGCPTDAANWTRNYVSTQLWFSDGFEVVPYHATFTLEPE